MMKNKQNVFINICYSLGAVCLMIRIELINTETQCSKYDGAGVYRNDTKCCQTTEWQSIARKEPFRLIVSCNFAFWLIKEDVVFVIHL